MNYSKFLKPIYLYGNKEQDQGAEGRELEKGIVFNEAILFRFARQRVVHPQRRRSVRIKDAIVGEHSTEAGPNEFIPHRAEQLELRLSTK